LEAKLKDLRESFRNISASKTKTGFGMGEMAQDQKEALPDVTQTIHEYNKVPILGSHVTSKGHTSYTRDAIQGIYCNKQALRY
jgi:hypothetical protein